MHKTKKLPLWKKTLSRTELIAIILASSIIVTFAEAGEASPVVAGEIGDFKVLANTVFVFFCCILVLSLNLGFAMLEAGLCRKKNAVNVLFKNLIIFALASICFLAIGFGIAFGDGNAFIGQSGFFLSGPDNSPATGDFYRGIYSSLKDVALPLNLKFLFHAAFAATAATIVSGAVAERIRPSAYMCFSLILICLVYPVAVHWIWADGWLLSLGFQDFAGATAVHSIGGWSALTGTLILGERIEKYQGARPVALPGHNLALATQGCLILFIGWFGFNCGSTMEASLDLATIALNTLLAASAGAVSATIASYIILQAPDLTFVINGILAGLVAITGGANCVDTRSALIIGTIAGLLVVVSILTFDRLRIDDPVGAISVHLVNGIWGSLAVGLFAIGLEKGQGLFVTGDLSLLTIQLLGIIAVAALAIASSIAIWKLLQFLLGSIRVSRIEELSGLDLTQHAGMECYPNTENSILQKNQKNLNANTPQRNRQSHC